MQAIVQTEETFDHPNLSQYGISNATKIYYNPSYELLFEHETDPALEGYERAVLKESDAVSVNTGEFTGRSTKDNEWIFVLSAADQTMYAHRKVTKSIPRFHHTSFLAAEPVQVAGQLEVDNGNLRSINLHSGHYRPSDEDFARCVQSFRDAGVPMDQVTIAAQKKRTEKDLSALVAKGVATPR